MFEYNDIKFRKLRREDLDSLRQLKEESWFGTHTVTFVNNEDQNRWFDSLDSNVGNPKNLMLFATNGGFHIGIYKISSIEWVNRTADVAWDVFEGQRGKGFGKKLVAAGVQFCFQMLNLRRLNAEILETNIASQKCAKAAGFVQEGVKREAVHSRKAEDRYVDSFVYGCLRS